MKRFMRWHIIALSLLLFLPACFERYNIHEVHNLEMLKEKIPSLNEHSLVVFDVDDTLLVSDTRILSMGNDNARALWLPLYQRLNKGIGNERFRYLFSKVWVGLTQELVDPQMPAVINAIKEMGAKVIVLTSSDTGKLGVIVNCEEFRKKELKKFGLDFSTSFSEYEHLNLPDPSGEDKKPVFYRGILCTDQVDKGTVLDEFFKAINWKPINIIHLDDGYKHVVSVAQIAQKRGIEFLGLHYHGATDLPCDIEPEVAQFMLKHLFEHEEWLTTDEVRKRFGDKK